MIRFGGHSSSSMKGTKRTPASDRGLLNAPEVQHLNDEGFLHVTTRLL